MGLHVRQFRLDLLSDSSSSFRASVWNLLSHKYKDVLMGLNGSKSKLSFRSFPSSVIMVPVYTTRPFGGTCEQNLGKKLEGFTYIKTRQGAELTENGSLQVHQD
jgi:hypothetical protein